MPYNKDMKRNASNIIVLVIAIVIAALIILTGALGRIKDNPPGTRGNTAGNLMNSGMFTEENGTVYFHNYAAGGALCSMTPDERDIKLIVDSNTEYINACGDYLYYYQKDHNNPGELAFLSRNLGVYRSDKNGEKTVCLLKKPVIVVNLIDSFVYYCFQNNETAALGISRKTIQNKKPETLTDLTIRPYLYYNGSFYYAGQDGDHYLHAYNIETGTDTVIFKGSVWNPLLDESTGTVYYMKPSDNYRLYRRSMFGGDETEERLTEDRVDCYNIAFNENYIYYQKNSEDEPAMKRMLLDGSEAETVLPGNYTDINFTSRYVYFRPFDKETYCFHQSISGPVSPSVFKP